MFRRNMVSDLPPPMEQSYRSEYYKHELVLLLNLIGIKIKVYDHRVATSSSYIT